MRVVLMSVTIELAEPAPPAGASPSPGVTNASGEFRPVTAAASAQ
jgi:hypothetical protein